MSFELCILASGSSGNCSVIRAPGGVMPASRLSALGGATDVEIASGGPQASGAAGPQELKAGVIEQEAVDAASVLSADARDGQQASAAALMKYSATDGDLQGVYLRLAGESLVIADATGELAVPKGALEIVMRRYGAPFDEQARITEVAKLDLGEGRMLRHVLHLAGYDVVKRDYLVLEGGVSEPLCAPGATVAAALQHLARAAARNGAGDG